MRRILRQLDNPQDDRLAMIGDALGVVALFALLYGALYIPLMT